ncbi:MAG: hypothetical protein GY826_29670, partial [Fuerstiella sp.]|nr:hypothetical protein [Fuerstiella sp.]
GDAFAPSGMDDYCVLNRNLLHDDSGYLLCLQKLRDIKEPFWLVNEHVPFVFSFSGDELDYLETRYRERISILKELFPWDDPNYGVDEQWAVMYPHGTTVASGTSVKLQLRLVNHSPTDRVYKVRFNPPEGMSLSNTIGEVSIAARQTGTVEVLAKAPDVAGHFVITADV